MSLRPSLSSAPSEVWKRIPIYQSSEDPYITGYSVSLSADGRTAVIGGFFTDTSVTALVYESIERNYGSDWFFTNNITQQTYGNTTSVSVSISGDNSTIAVGVPYDDSTSNITGHTRVYLLNGTQLGSDIDGSAVGDYAGISVSLSETGDHVAIGAPSSSNSTSSGYTQVYKWDGSSWAQVGSNIDGEAAGDQFGFSVSLSNDGGTVAIGAPSSGGGYTRVHKWDGTNWAQVGSNIDGEATGDKSVSSVSLSNDGETVAIGAKPNDGNGYESGYARVYKWNGSIWTQIGSDIVGEMPHVSLSGDASTIAVLPTLYAVQVLKWDGSSWAQFGSDIPGYFAAGFHVSLSDDGDTVAFAEPNYPSAAGGGVSIYDQFK